MKPSQLLDHFDRISEAPDAVPHLRRFILGLAVRGKLVEHDQENESASTMLERVRTERARLVREQRIATTRSLPLIEETEVPFALPAHWEWVRVGDVFLYDAGDKREPRELDADRWLLELEDIERDTSVILARLSVADRHSLSTKSEFRAGDILYGKLRPYLNKVVVAREAGYSTTEIVAIRSFVPFCAEYSCLAFRRPDFVEYVNRLGRGTKMPRLRTPDALMALFPLPPLAEQYRIAAKVDELMALCDRLAAAQVEREQRRDRLTAASLHRLNQPAEATDVAAFRNHARFHIRHLARFTTRPDQIPAMRQAILNLAVRGRLVAQDAHHEPVVHLLELIQTERQHMVQQGVLKRLQTMLSIAEEETPFTLPIGWAWVRIGDLLLGDSRNGYSKKPDDASDGIPILRISAGTVRKDGVVAEEEHKLIGGVSLAQQQQYQLQPGDLLACRFNGNRCFVGRLSIYLGYLPIAPIYPDKLIRLRLFSQFVLPKLVRCFAESAIIRKDIEGYCATTVGNWGISASNLKNVKLPLPPFAEQQRIVARVDELMAVCEGLEARLMTAQTERRRLLEAVLHEALSRAA